MTNEELQTLISNACNAAGIEYNHISGYRVIGIGATGMKVMEKFNPADDDGDSRMLQVACKIALHFEVIGGEWCAEAYSVDTAESMGVCAYEPLKDDDRKAARLAVLRCAGMTGEAME